MFKRLVSDKGKEYFINRDKVSALKVVSDDITIFYMDTHVLYVAISYENAILWLMSQTPFDGPPRSLKDTIAERGGINGPD